MGEVVISKEVKLVEEVANIDAAQWIHPGEGQDAGEAGSSVSRSRLFSNARAEIIPLFLARLLRAVPANIEYLVIFLQCLYWHWHVVICGYDLAWPVSQGASRKVQDLSHLLEIVAESSFQKLSILFKKLQLKIIENPDREFPRLVFG